ncbi:AMP-binding protein [Acinetobacter sp. VNH17]|uniref:AMP-binding protein n=1 Tax=Acinetobacter thutiue TaxID=2998078 RepID=A0ABT7WM09_9GAMM|nr:AMP-binding protein [Acinetobacter thutiue]MCY6411608.1 AMP-binding protein [Acinetobacter thutiue]MDN0013710.1 AMP-binding protein [Acinetobacter thutiue]
MSDYTHNLVSLLVYHAQTRPEAIALRHKKFGLWQQWSWQKLLQLSEKYASALDRYGFTKGQSFLILSTPNTEVVAISLAIQALGGKVQLIDHGVEQLAAEALLNHLAIIQPDYILIEQLEQLGSLQQLNYHPAYIFYIEHSNASSFNHDYIVDLMALLADERGHAQLEFKRLPIQQSQLAFSFERVEANQRFRVCYSHQELIEEAQQLIHTHDLDHNEEAFIARAFSSVGHIRYLWSSWLLAGFSLNIPETLQTRDQDRQVIAPTLVLGTQATYVRVEQLISRRLPQPHTWLAKTYQSALLKLQQKQKLTLVQRGIIVLFRQVILEELGFSRLKTALIVGQPVEMTTQQFYQGLGVQLQHWGQYTEWRSTQVSVTPHDFPNLPITTIN